MPHTKISKFQKQNISKWAYYCGIGTDYSCAHPLIASVSTYYHKYLQKIFESISTAKLFSPHKPNYLSVNTDFSSIINKSKWSDFFLIF